MAISIKEALQLPVMKVTKLVGGHLGVANNIKWVTVVEILEDIHRFQDGEFLITTGFGMDENPGRLENLQILLSSNKLSGLAIYTSFYMKKIPESLITVANENNLPLIEIPTDINFSIITKAILEQIVNNQMYRLEYSAKIHKQLTRLVLNNRSLTEITNTLAKLTGATTIIYNDAYHVIYDKQLGNDILHLNGTKITFANSKIDLQKELYRTLEIGTATHKIISNYKITICPIIAKQNCYGWITMIKPIEQWRELDEIAIEHAATIYAIEFIKNQAVEETKIRLQGDFLEDVFNQNYLNEKTIIEQGKMLGYDLTLNQAVFYITFDNPDHIKDYLFEKLYYMIEQLLLQKNKQHLIQTKLDSLTLLTNVSGNDETMNRSRCYDLAIEINKEWVYFFPEQRLKIGIGKHYQDVPSLSSSLREAQYAVRLSNLLSNQSHITHYDDLGMYDLLLEMKHSGIDLTSIYLDNLESLMPSTKKGIDLIETLDSYLTNNQNIKETADQLFIHRHTLRYRLNQIEIRSGFDLKSVDERLKLQLSTMAYKLMGLLKQDRY